jgi:hypothetical protein
VDSWIIVLNQLIVFVGGAILYLGGIFGLIRGPAVIWILGAILTVLGAVGLMTLD